MRKNKAMTLANCLLLQLFLMIFSGFTAKAYDLSAKAFDIISYHSILIGDTTIPQNGNLVFPIYDSRGDFLSTPKNTYDFKLPPNIKDSVAYDPTTKLYTVYEKIGTKYYRSPVTYTFDEYWTMINEQAEKDYFQSRSNTMSLLNRTLVKPKLSIYDNLFNRLFGNGKIDITPQGNVDVTAGYQGQNINNPTLPERARKNGGFDFNMDAQVNVNANIGDKLKFPINYNTLANFGQENQLKLDYTGLDDEIIKKIEAGNVTFTSRSTFIPSAQQLFGLKTQLQFGKLNITAVLANQKSQQQSTNLQGGAATQLLNIKADEYEENRHFLLGQYFRSNFNKVMGNLPAITTPVQILRMEVWVTNRSNIVLNAREVVGLADLGESNPYNGNLPANGATGLYSTVISNPSNRNPSAVFSNLQNLGLTPVQDFEKTYAHKLDSTQYIFNPQVGFLSLNQPLQPDDVLAVAYQYTYNGQVYQVGEFSEDLPPDSTTAIQKILFLKLLKATSQRVNLPIWGLMMKNVYSVGNGVLSPADFKLDILYQQPSLGKKRYVPFGNKNLGIPILKLDNLDRLNSQMAPQPDGVFDYVEGYTVISQYSRIIFPVLEPFGRDLAAQIYNVVPPTAKDTLFYALYDSIKAVAQQYPNLNRFLMTGSSKSSGGASSSSDISIGYNIPRGSVTVTAGGQTLVEGSDYIINYDLGTIRIINQSILNTGQQVQVKFENNAAFGIQQKSFMGLRLDYNARNTPKEQLIFGATMARLSERPFFTKVNYGEDPIKNTIYGADVTYKKDMSKLTKILNKLPFYQSTAASTMNAYGEMAYLKPGHANQIGSGSSGAVYIDDFEGSTTGIDLRVPSTSWALASVPFGATDSSGNQLFPEAQLNDDLNSGKNRAKIAWYQIEPALQMLNGPNNPLGGNKVELDDPRVRAVSQTEIFPNMSTEYLNTQLVTFDLAYYPTDRGPYNYDATPGDVDANGKLLKPQARWGGLMRSIDQTDFETANIEFIEFWMQDPFINTPQNPNATQSSGGKLYFNLGDVSEDILKDGKRFYENGLPTPNIPAQVDTSAWGKVPLNPISITNSFDNDPTDRLFQDVGFDGLNDDSERIVRKPYLNQMQSIVSPATFQRISADPSSDDFLHYRDASFTANDGILIRYKNYNGPEGNSKVNNGTAYSTAATMYPDAEDLDHDNSLNETESYFQYMVNIQPSQDPSMAVGQNFIVDKKQVTVTLQDQTTRVETWYQFRIPVTSYNANVGNIPDFKSIRFMRMFLTGFQDSVVMRFGELQLTRDTWRNYTYKVDTTGAYNPVTNNANFTIGAVNIIQNDSRIPLPYRMPAAVQRQQIQSSNGQVLLQNEQSMSLSFCGLNKGDTRGVFQTFANRDFRQYGTLLMYLHAENDITAPSSFNNKDLNAVIRFGSDFTQNYYEVKIPLYITPLTAASLASSNSTLYADTLWQAINNLNVDLALLPKMKQTRNACSSCRPDSIYRQLQPSGQTYSIMGDPNLGEVAGILISVENDNSPSACGQIWVDELRLGALNEHGGWAGMGKMNVTLSDLGSVTASMTGHTAGFGTLEQTVNQRYQDNFTQFDVGANLELGKLLPKKAAISVPFLASYSQAVSTPLYDPFDMDIRLKDKLAAALPSQRDSIKNYAVTYTSTKTLSLTNIHKNKTNKKKPKIYDISNFYLSYSYLNTKEHDPLTQSSDITRHRGGLGYNFVPKTKPVEPFKKMKFFTKRKKHWFDLVKDFNFNPVPSQLSFKADINRQFSALELRSIGTSLYNIPVTYDKYFTFKRDYIMRWALTKSLNLDFAATNNSTIDEPAGALDTKAKKDTVWQNLLKGGRNTLYTQTANASYTLPTSKFPLLDWTSVNLKYQTNYTWIAASLVDPALGNILENGQQQEATAQLDFSKLYNKLKFFRAIEKPRPKIRSTAPKKYKIDTLYRYIMKDGIITKEVKKVKKTVIRNPNSLPDVGVVERMFGKLITSVKMVNVSFSQNANTRLPGYTDSTRIIGQNWKSMAPGLDFVFGRQPDTNWINRAATRGLLTKDSSFNSMIQQSLTQRITLSAQLQPVRDFNITVNVTKSFSKSYSELFKDTTGTGGYFGHLSPYAGGSFDVSFISFKTLFNKFDPNRVSGTFNQFQNNRLIISNRVGNLNPYNKGISPGADGYAYGYDRYASDVLIPAFIAAYSGQDPNKVALIKESNPNIHSNPFSRILPEPNWKIDYNGLSKLPGLNKIFKSLTISHGYSGDLSMNGFTSALFYQDKSHYGYPSFYDTVSRNYTPYFLVPNITIQEQFAPLIGIDMMLTNQFQAKFEYLKQRILSLSLIDYQVSETRSTGYTFGAGYRKRGLKLLAGLKLPKFLSKDGKSKLDNEINFRLDVKVTDNATANSQLDQNNTVPTSGSKEITISPTVDYYLNSRINVKFYFDRRQVIPYVQSTAAITTTRAGVQIRISLAQPKK